MCRRQGVEKNWRGRGEGGRGGGGGGNTPDCSITSLASMSEAGESRSRRGKQEQDGGGESGFVSGTGALFKM